MVEMQIVARIVVLATAIGINIADFCKSFRKKIYKTYSLSWLKKKRLRHVIDTEFFIWSWALATYYGSVHFLNQQMSEEAALYQEIFEDYFVVVSEHDNSYDIYDFWKNYIEDVLNISEKDYQGRKGYDERVLEKLTTMLSLKILKYVHRDIVELDIKDLNEIYRQHIMDVQEDLKIIVYLIIDVLNHYLKEADESNIQIAFEAAHNREPVKSLITKWQANY